jgi:hypothetical protein
MLLRTKCGILLPSISGSSASSRTRRLPPITSIGTGSDTRLLEHWSADVRYYDTDYSKQEASFKMVTEWLRRAGGRNLKVTF